MQTQTPGAPSAQTTPPATVIFTGDSAGVMDDITRVGVTGTLTWQLPKEGSTDTVGSVLNLKGGFQANMPVNIDDVGIDGDKHELVRAVSYASGYAWVAYTGEFKAQQLIEAAKQIVQGANLDGKDDNTAMLIGRGNTSVAIVDLDSGKAKKLNFDAMLKSYQATDYWLSIDKNGNATFVVADGDNAGAILSMRAVYSTALFRDHELPIGLFDIRGNILLGSGQMILRTGKVDQFGGLVVNIGDKSGKLTHVAVYMVDHDTRCFDRCIEPNQVIEIDTGRLNIPSGWAVIGNGALPGTLGLIGPGGQEYMVINVDNEDPNSATATLAKLWDFSANGDYLDQLNLAGHATGDDEEDVKDDDSEGGDDLQDGTQA